MTDCWAGSLTQSERRSHQNHRPPRTDPKRRSVNRHDKEGTNALGLFTEPEFQEKLDWASKYHVPLASWDQHRLLSQLAQFRLLVLYTAWKIDQSHDYRQTRKDIAAIRMLTPKVVHDAVWRSMHAHGALGVSNEMPFSSMWSMALVVSVVDGPTEVQKVRVAAKC